jgi:hypothetical protein
MLTKPADEDEKEVEFGRVRTSLAVECLGVHRDEPGRHPYPEESAQDCRDERLRMEEILQH